MGSSWKLVLRRRARNAAAAAHRRAHGVNALFRNDLDAFHASQTRLTSSSLEDSSRAHGSDSERRLDARSP
jgi:hypothetical protein